MRAMAGRLRIPAVLAVIVVAGGVTAAALTTSCGDDPPRPDATCEQYCIDTTGSGNCPFPTCATGPSHDQCPPGCEVEIV
jgi:hypothetical protein